MGPIYFQQTEYDRTTAERYGLVITVGGDHFRAVYDDSTPLPSTVDTAGYRIDYEAEHAESAQRPAGRTGSDILPFRP